MSGPRSQTNKIEQEVLLADSPFPIMPLKPRAKGARRRRINYEELRAQIMQTEHDTLERQPSPPPIVTTPRRRKTTMDMLFINRKPLETASPLRIPTERVRRATAPYSSPCRPQNIRRTCSDPLHDRGPAPWIVYTRVPQNPLYPTELEVDERPIYPPDDDVVLGSWERLGCCIITPDAVSKETLNIRSTHIEICFQWIGYEQYGVFWAGIDIPKFQDDPFGSRLTILCEIKKLFEEFRCKVAILRPLQYRRSVGVDFNIPGVDVLAFSKGDIRVTKLQRRVESLYQVVFTYPTRNDR
ncbi:hypothetical protein ACEPAF_8174 [Sanghuangporus sanghuang]